MSIHGMQPAYLQRAIFVVILSFLFFMGTMIIFYLRQGFVYFFLSTAFLIIYLVTMFSWIAQRRNIVKIYENGLEYRKYTCLWSEIESIGAGEKNTVEVRTKAAGRFAIPATIAELDEVVIAIKNKI